MHPRRVLGSIGCLWLISVSPEVATAASFTLSDLDQSRALASFVESVERGLEPDKTIVIGSVKAAAIAKRLNGLIVPIGTNDASIAVKAIESTNQLQSCNLVHSLAHRCCLRDGTVAESLGRNV